MIQMELAFADQVPDNLGSIDARPGSPRWREQEVAMNDIDKRFPVRSFPIECKSIRGEITIRPIEDGAEGPVVLWGVQYWNRKTQTGEGFAPLRKWGPRFAAITERDAIAAATRYVRAKGGES